MRRLTKNIFGGGSYMPSKEVRDRISTFEGAAMTGAKDPLSGKWGKNRSFEDEARDFYAAIPESIRDKVLDNPELADNLFSYSYNVGAGAFKRRVVPILLRYYNHDASAAEVANSLWASGDSKLRGLRRRREEEKAGVFNALQSPVAAEPAVSTAVYYPYTRRADLIQPIPIMIPNEDKIPEVTYDVEERPRQDALSALKSLGIWSKLKEQNAWENQEPQQTFVPQGGINYVISPYAEGGELDSPKMWDDLSMTEKAEMMKVAIRNGITNLNDIRKQYNEFAEGGKIHIKEKNRGKFTRLKERTGHSASWFKAHGTPAQKKMVNARKWKHGLGGHIFDGLSEPTQFLNFDISNNQQDETAPWQNQDWIDDDIAQKYEDIRHPQGHLMDEVTVSAPYASDSHRMRANLLESMAYSAQKNARDAYTLQRNMNQAQNSAAKAVGLGLGAAATLPAFMGAVPTLVPALGTATTAIATPGSAFWMNPFTQQMSASILGGTAVDATSKIATGKTWGENVGNIIDTYTGYNPNESLVGNVLTDFTNPGYLTPYGLISNVATKAPDAMANLVQGAGRTFDKGRKFLSDVYLGPENLRRRLWDLEQRVADYSSNFRQGEIDAAYNDFKKTSNLVSRARSHDFKVGVHVPTNRNDLFIKANKRGRNEYMNLDKMSEDDLRAFFEGKVDNPEVMISSYDPSTFTFSRTIEVPKTRSFDPNDAVQTGDFEITDLRTGKPHQFNITFGNSNTGTVKSQSLSFDTKTGVYTKSAVADVDKGVTSRLNPTAPKEYRDVVQSNMDYITDEVLPGSRAFGSSTNIARGNLAHASHDIDVIMTEAQARSNPAFKEFYEKIPGATYGYNHPTAGEIDINVIREKSGKAYGQRAHELYAQLHPKEYRELMMQYAKEGKNLTTDLPLNVSSQELLDAYDPVTKGIIDAFGSSKPKHMKRALYYLHYGDINDVRKGFEGYANYLLGGNYQPSNVALSEFSDASANSTLIDELGLSAINKEEFINNPERMKLLFDYAVFDKTFVGRGVNGVNSDPIKSLTYWYPQTFGGTAHGVGLNTVVGGDSGFGSVYGTIVPNRMPSMNGTTSQEVLNSLVRNRELTSDEVDKVLQLASKHGITMPAPHDLTEILVSTENQAGKNYKSFINELAEQFDIPFIRNGRFGNADYASLLEDQSEANIQQLILDGMDRPTPAQYRDDYAKSTFDADQQLREKAVEFEKGIDKVKERLPDRSLNSIYRRMKERQKSSFNLPEYMTSQNTGLSKIAVKVMDKKGKAYHTLRDEVHAQRMDDNLMHREALRRLENNYVKYVKLLRHIRNAHIAAGVGGGSLGVGYGLAKATEYANNKRKERIRDRKYLSLE